MLMGLVAHSQPLLISDSCYHNHRLSLINAFVEIITKGVYFYIGINARMLFSCKEVFPLSFPLIAMSGRKKTNKTFVYYSKKEAIYERCIM